MTSGMLLPVWLALGPLAMCRDAGSGSWDRGTGRSTARSWRRAFVTAVVGRLCFRVVDLRSWMLMLR